MLSELALSRALERAGLHAPVRFDEVTRSTQETAQQMAAEGAPEWTLVAAGHQTEGRGRLGRRWSDEPGRALMFSLVLRPDLAPGRGGLLSLLAGVAMVRAVDEADAAATSASCKWPNDVLVDGRKAGGILAESRVTADRFAHVVLGIGVNLGAAPADVPGAGAVDTTDERLLEAFLRAFAEGYRTAAPTFATAVVAAYRERCATIGTRVRATTTEGTAVEGEAIDLDEAGGLVVRTGDGPVTVRFGEVEHLE